MRDFLKFVWGIKKSCHYFFFVFGSFGAAKIQIQGRFRDSEIAKAHTDTVTKFSDSVAGAVARLDFWRENQRTRITIRFFSVLFWPGNHTHLLGFRPLGFRPLGHCKCRHCQKIRNGTFETVLKARLSPGPYGCSPCIRVSAF